YGLILRYKRTIPILIISGAVGGAINGSAGTKMTSYIFHNIFSIAAYSPMITHVISISASFLTATILVSIFGFESKNGNANPETTHVEDTKIPVPSTPKKAEQIQVNSPLTGKVIPLQDVDDTVFSSEAMGEGLAVEPSIGEILAPFDGFVSAVFPTKHAI